MPPYDPEVKSPRLVDRMLRVIQAQYRKKTKPHRPRNTKHGRPRGR